MILTLDFRNATYFIAKKKQSVGDPLRLVLVFSPARSGFLSPVYYRYKMISAVCVSASEHSTRYLKCTKAREQRPVNIQ